MKNPFRNINFSSSITDWIQTIAVVITLGFVVWQLVIQDRAERFAKRENVRNLVIAGLGETTQSGFSALIEIGTNINKIREMDEKEKLKVQTKVAFLKEYYSAWAFTYSANLCDRQLALRKICPEVLEYERLINTFVLGDPDLKSLRISSEDYKDLISACENRRSK